MDAAKRLFKKCGINWDNPWYECMLGSVDMKYHLKHQIEKINKQNEEINDVFGRLDDIDDTLNEIAEDCKYAAEVEAAKTKGCNSWEQKAIIAIRAER